VESTISHPLQCLPVMYLLHNAFSPPQVIVYTASLSKYADPLLDKLDVHKVRHQTFRLTIGSHVIVIGVGITGY